MYGDPILGGGQDANVWYRCWFCKQLNSVETSTLGGSDSPSGAVYVDYADSPDYTNNQGVAVLSGISTTYTAQQNGSDGSPIGVMNAIMCSDNGTGCRFCGSKNWRGDYP